jgi:hypothetical protein
VDLGPIRATCWRIGTLDTASFSMSCNGVCSACISPVLPRSRALLPSLLPPLDLQFQFRGCHLVGPLFLSNAVLSCSIPGSLFQDVSLVILVILVMVALLVVLVVLVVVRAVVLVVVLVLVQVQVGVLVLALVLF